MGYTGLGSWMQSDTASELRHNLKSAAGDKTLFNKFVQAAIKNRANKWNTEGCVNLALLLEEGEFTPTQLGSRNLKAIARRLKELVESEYNDSEHLEAYLRLEKVIDGMIADQE